MALAASRQRMRVVLQDRGARWVLAGWTVFTVENLIMSEYKADIKQLWGGAGGPGAYMNFYATLSTAAMGSTVAAYYRFAQHGAQLPAPSAKMRVLAFVFRTTGLAMISQLLPPINLGALSILLGFYEAPKDLPQQVRGQMACPFDFNAYASRGEVYGITRV
ncbi:unnamed protein product, partial [Polarella glacialis]